MVRIQILKSLSVLVIGSCLYTLLNFINFLPLAIAQSRIPSSCNPNYPPLRMLEAAYWAWDVGFTEEDAVIILAIAWAESSGNPFACYYNSSSDSWDRGILQINDLWHPEVDDACAFDPGCAFNSARNIRFNDWVTYNNGMYRNYLDSAQQNISKVISTVKLYGGTNGPGSIYRYLDDNLWVLIGSEEKLSHVYSVNDLIEYNGNLYAATSTDFDYRMGMGRVYKYNKGGKWTLIGDNMDSSVNDLEIYNGELYAGTSGNGFRLYKYTPGTTNCGIQNWTRVIDDGWNGVRALYNDGYNLLLGDVYWDYIGHWDGSNFNRDQYIATGSCIYDFEEFGGDLYASAYHGRLWHSSDGINWNLVLGSYDGNMWKLEKYRNRLYMSYNNGELRRTDGSSLRGELVYRAPDGIISMTTDGNYLYFGTGGDAVGLGGETSGIANVYRYNGINTPEPIWDPPLAGIQVLYISGQELLRAARQNNLPRWREISENIGTVSSGSTGILRFFNNIIRDLRVILNWPGSTLLIQLYQPNGTLYKEYQSDTPPIIIDIPNAEKGVWQFQVIPINIPYDNYPFALVVAAETEITTNQPPVAMCKNVTLSADNTCKGNVSIDNGSYDPDGDSITLIQNPSGPYGLGSTMVSLLVVDSYGASDSCTGIINVIDTTRPIIENLSASPNVLWPPNHKMVPVNVNLFAFDNCDPNPYCKVISIDSNEPENGLGDGDMSPDWEITGDLTLKLSAERSGKGSGRFYTVTVMCTDSNGNSTTRDVIISVPHDMRK